MNTDIRLKVGFLDNPKVIKLQRRHGDGAVLGLLRFWFYVAENKPTGILTGIDSEDIDIACGSHAFSMHDALLDLGFLHQTKTGYKVHDWEENQSWVFNAPKRSKAAKTAADTRWKSDKKPIDKTDAPRMLCAYDPHADGNAPFLSFPFLSLPIQLSTSREFAEAWVEWENARREQKKKLTESAVKKQIDMLAKLSIPDAIATINKSIECGYQGLFPPKNNTTEERPEHFRPQGTVKLPDSYYAGLKKAMGVTR